MRADLIGCRQLSVTACAFLALAIWVVRPASSGELVRFESAHYQPSLFKVKRAKERGIDLRPGKGVPIAGYLYRPEGKGPFPAIVLMHGCGGISRANHLWRRSLVQWGYVVLDVDSISPRGIRGIICFRSDLAGPLTRARDAHGARTYLAGLPFVAQGRVGIMGISHGAMSALQAINRSTTERVDGVAFQAAVALYPICEPNTQPNAPVLILVGELDNWANPASCERYLAKLGPDHDIALKVYAGAHHSFDVPGVDTAWRGHFVRRYNQEAAKDAKKEVRAFFRKHLN